MCLLVLCLMPDNLLDPNDSFASFSKRLTISPVVERLVFSKVCSCGIEKLLECTFARVWHRERARIRV